MRFDLLASLAALCVVPAAVMAQTPPVTSQSTGAPQTGQSSTSSARTTAPTSSATLTSSRAPFRGNSTSTASPSSSSASAFDPSAPPDVYLNVPQLSVGRIELDVEQLRADINLNARVAGLVTLNAGVQVSVEKINITIADVDVQLELVVRLGHLVDIVNRVFESVDLNPLIISVANATEALVGDVVSAVDGLLGTITQGGTTLSFVVDSLGNIVQQVTGTAGNTLDSIVGNYKQNMTLVGNAEQLANGLTKGTYSYSPLNALVDIVTNTAGQVVQAVVQKTKSGSGGSPASSTTSASSSSAPPSTAATTT